MVGRHEWKHNWIPLTPAAALLKAKGSRVLAGRLRQRYGINGRDTRSVVRSSRQTSLPDRPSAHERGRADVGRGVVEAADRRRATAELRRLSDDQLADRLAQAGDDDQAVESVLRELDRRDRAAQSAIRRTEARQRAREAKERVREADFDRRVAAGEDPEEAYADAYGTTVEKLRRQEAIDSLRRSGYRGGSFDALVRDAFRQHVRQAQLHAEDVTNGYFTNPAGRRARINGESLFTGPESRARKYASRELLDYWQEHGRMTVDDFKASLLGGSMRSASTAAWS